jgi:hypothetical protein
VSFPSIVFQSDRVVLENLLLAGNSSNAFFVLTAEPDLSFSSMLHARRQPEGYAASGLH